VKWSDGGHLYNNADTAKFLLFVLAMAKFKVHEEKNPKMHCFSADRQYGRGSALRQCILGFFGKRLRIFEHIQIFEY
jgi:hypothetical protein